MKNLDYKKRPVNYDRSSTKNTILIIVISFASFGLFICELILQLNEILL